jgi:8-oxo-dGTP diphosphatase
VSALADYPLAFPPFAVMVDVIVFTIENDQLMVVLIERGEEPDSASLALPGGFVRPEEDLIDAAMRELHEGTGLENQGLTELGAYGRPGRDPKLRVVTIGYWVIVPHLPEPIGEAGVSGLKVAVDDVLLGETKLPLDQDLIIGDGLEQARRALENTTVATDFCDTEFTITELRKVYEIVWGVNLDQGNFQNKVLEIENFVVPTGRRRAGGRGRPPELFTAGSALVIDPPFRRPLSDGSSRRSKWLDSPKPSMSFQGYVDRVAYHLERLGATDRPTQQEYVDAWNNQIPAGTLAQTFIRRRRRK